MKHSSFEMYTFAHKSIVTASSTLQTSRIVVKVSGVVLSPIFWSSSVGRVRICARGSFEACGLVDMVLEFGGGTTHRICVSFSLTAVMWSRR